MPQLIDSQTCEGVGWNPRLYTGVKHAAGRFEYQVWTPDGQLRKRTANRKVAIGYFRAIPGAVLRMQRSASDTCLGIAINDGSGFCVLPEECFAT